MKKKILVTGGAGFIGSHLCSRLLSAGHEVFCLDNFYTSSLSNIVALAQFPGFHLLKMDVCDPLDIAVDQIYNLACPASPYHYQKDSVYTIKTNVIGALNVLELANKCDAVVLQASTSEIYGCPSEHPQTEQYWGNVNPIGIRSCYDEGKRCAETLFFDYHRQYGTQIKVARIFNTYGPHMDVNDGRVVSNFVIQALRGCEISIYGDGRQTRSFCYVDDIVAGLICLMESETEIAGPINLGNPNEITVLELVERIRKLVGIDDTKLKFLPLPQDDPRQRQPDISLAMQKLDWRPTISLEDGLSRTIEYFRFLLKRLIKEE